MPLSPSPMTGNASLDVHRGAIDQTTITSRPPQQVMQRMDSLLRDMGIWVEKETPFRYRCIRLKKDECAAVEDQTPDDRTDEVRFTVELTRLAGLSDTYSLDIRRLKGNLRGYKSIYDTIRDRAELN